MKDFDKWFDDKIFERCHGLQRQAAREAYKAGYEAAMKEKPKTPFVAFDYIFSEQCPKGQVQLVKDGKVLAIIDDIESSP